MAQGLRIFLLLFPALVLFAALLPLYFAVKRRGETRSATYVKALCTLVLIVFCLNGCVVNRFVGFWWILAALVFCMLGDIAIESQLIAGVTAFFIAHTVFIYAFTVFAPPTWSAVPVFLILFAVAGFVFRKQFGRMGVKIIPFLFYAAVLFAMLSLALTLPTSNGTLLIAAGAVLFALSDALLALSYVHGKNPSIRREVVNLACYYAALYLISLAVWV